MSRPAVSTSSSSSSTAASSSSSSSSLSARVSAWPWRAFAIATAVVAGTSLACVLMRRKLQSAAGSSTSSVDDDMPSLESVPTRPPLLTEEDFSEACQSFLQALGETERVDPRSEKELRDILPTALAKFSNEARALGSHFLLATHAYHLTHSQNEEEFNQLMISQMTDMQLAWQLLECAPQSDVQLRALDVMRLQVAQCLRDASLMLEVFERMIKQPMDSFSDEEVTLLFTTAPLLGRWSQTVQLGEALIAKKCDLEEFHHAPMDFHVLFEIAKSEREKGNAHQQALQWKNYRIVMQRIKLRSASCPEDEDIVRSLQAEFMHEGEKTWKMLQMGEASRLVRCGALCQLRSFSPVALALVGPASESRIFVKGHGLMGNAQQQPVAKQAEAYNLLRVQRHELEGADAQSNDDGDEEGAMHWKGSFDMEQEATPDAPAGTRIPTLKAVFELEMTIVPIQ